MREFFNQIYNVGDLGDFERFRYTSTVHNDKVDLMLEEYINDNHVLIPIQRIKEGKYLFGAR